MARTRLVNLLRRAAAIAAQARLSGEPVDEAIGRDRALRALGARRRFLQQSAGAAAVLTLAACARMPPPRSERGDDVVIVGAGVAGLTAAWRLRQQGVRVRVYEDKLEVLHAGKPQLVVDRLAGRNGHRINYRHIIWSLVQKPGAFAQYRYREDLFPSLVFRQAYDELQRVQEGRAADVEYLRILHLSASTLEAQVEQVLARLLAEGGLRGAEQVKALVAPARPEVPELAQPEVDLRGYDALLVEQREVAS